MNLNMHAIVRGAITSINEDVPGTVYVSTGRTNVRGILTPQFTGVDAMLQVQAKQHSPAQQPLDRGMTLQNSYFTVYAFGNFTDLDRPDGSGGDVCNFRGQFWAITQVLEWWPTWCALEVTRQLDAQSIGALVAQIANGAVVTQ